MKICFYFSYAGNPEWGEWVIPWRNSKETLYLLSQEIPVPCFDLYNPNIIWVSGLPGSPDTTFVRLLSLDFYPVSPEKGIHVGDLYFPTDQYGLRLDPEHVDRLFLHLLETPTTLDSFGNQLLFKLCWKKGEWKCMENLFGSCGWKEGALVFHKSLLKWGLQRRNPDRDAVFRDEIINNFQCWKEESWLWLLRLYQKHPEWDRSFLYLERLVPCQQQPTQNLEWRENKETFSLEFVLLKDEPRVQNALFQHMLYQQDKRYIHEMKPFVLLLEKEKCEAGDVFVDETISGDFVPSSAGMCVYPNNPDVYVVNVRSVNYKIQEDGSYKTFLDGKECVPYNGISKNQFYFMDRKTLNPIHYKMMVMRNEKLPPPRKEELAIMGVEDIRLFQKEGKIYFYGSTKEYSYTDKIRILYGVYSLETCCLEEPIVCRPPKETMCEKNWVWAGEKIIYKWFPLQIGVMEKERLVLTQSIQAPPLFEELRGSTPGCLWENQWWVLVHMVRFEEGKRVYIHFMVVFDRDLTEIKGVSRPFVFEKEQIEYCVGMDIIDDKILFLYSTMDRTSKYIRVPLQPFKKKMVWIFKCFC